jgi:hypothetical protein
VKRFRIGLALGFAAGYYFGSKAGRERYDQIRASATHLRRSRPVRKIRAAIELGLERVRNNDNAVQLVLVDERDAAAQGSSR